jgi:hypothetical protein
MLDISFRKLLVLSPGMLPEGRKDRYKQNLNHFDFSHKLNLRK